MNQAKILIVDDIKANRDILKYLVVSLGHTPLIVENGRSALALMEDQLPDIILLDIIMPEMDGYEVLNYIKDNSNLRHIPVIMISAIDEIDSVVKCIEKGADDYLTKPFKSALLKSRIGACLEKKWLRDREMQLHEKLLENYDALKNAERARDTMVHMIVHDLRNLLSIVLGHAQILQVSINDDDTDKEEISNCLEGIIVSSEEMSSLIRTILDVSKLESGELPVSFSTINASQVIKGLCKQYDRQAQKKGAFLSIKTESDNLMVKADKSLLSRILQNLVNNAFKHTTKGTNVTMSAKRDGENIVFSVTDNGPGIPGKYKDKIFDKYFQIETGDKRKKHGIGLGLTFCKMATEAQGGKIWVESQEGKGTSFKVALKALDTQ